MLKYTSLILLIGSCITATASASINWGQFLDPAVSKNTKTLEFAAGTQAGTQYTTFSNVNGSGIDMRLVINGDGFLGAKIEHLHYGHSAPAYNYGDVPNGGPGAPHLGLVFESRFAGKGQDYTVSFEFYENGEQVSVNSIAYTIYGIGVEQPHAGWNPGWGKQDYRDVVSDIQATFDGVVIPGNARPGEYDDPFDYVGLSTGPGINDATAASSAGINPTEYGFQQGIYYGTSQDWRGDSSNQGNISAVYNAPVDSIGFTFGNSGDVNVADKPNNNQYFGIGDFDFGEIYDYIGQRGNDQNPVPEPGTYALLLTVAIAGIVMVRRRKA